MQQGVIDGLEGNMNAYSTNGSSEVCKNMSLTNHLVGTCGAYISTKVWNSIPEEYRTIIQEEFTKGAKELTDFTNASFDETKAKLEKEQGADGRPEASYRLLCRVSCTCCRTPGIAEQSHRKQREANLKKVLKNLDAYIAGVMMIVTIVLVIVNVFTRKMFNYIIIWSEEIATSCFVYSVFIGAAYAYRKHQHVGVDLLVERLPAGARRAVHLITSALLVVINGYITMLSVQFIQSSWIKRMPITKLPSSVVSTALVIGFGLMTIYSLVIFIKDLKSGNKLDGEVDA